MRCVRRDRWPFADLDAKHRATVSLENRIVDGQTAFPTQTIAAPVAEILDSCRVEFSDVLVPCLPRSGFVQQFVAGATAPDGPRPELESETFSLWNKLQIGRSSVNKLKLKIPTTYNSACSLLARMMTTAMVHGPSSHRRYNTRNGPLDADYFDQAKAALLDLASDSTVERWT